MEAREPVKPLGGWFASTINRVSMIAGVIAGVFLCVMALSMGYEVFARYILRHPTLWVFEVSHYMLIVVITWGMAYGLIVGAHVRVTTILERLSPRAQKWVHAVTSLLTVGMVGALLWASSLFLLRTLQRHEVSTTLLQIPLSWPRIGIVIGLFIFFWLAAVMCWDSWQKLVSGDNKV